ncbi:unnamed protein product [Scytosiphon promiscuus]
MARPEASKRPRDARKRQIGSEFDARRMGLADGDLVGAVLRRQATGGKGVKNETFVLGATGVFHKRLRKQLEGVPEMIADVKKNQASGDHAALLAAVLAIRTKLVEGTSAPFELPVRPGHSRSGHGAGGGGGGGGGGGAEHHHGHNHDHHGEEDDEDNPYSYRQVRRLDREAFVALGGPDLLLKVLRRPGSPADARNIPAADVERDMPVWNTVLVILRELCFTDQDLSDRLGSSELILYLLTLMAHQGVFDLAVGLVEEILAVKTSTYFLGEVPDLHSLVDNMTSQQLAHFSRVLALLVFEPEYRQLMESAHVLRSMELLQLRRDRVVRADSIIDKNQALILSAPSLLPRLMELLRVMNFNPSLASFDERAIELEEAHIAQVRISVVTGMGVGRTNMQRRWKEKTPSSWRMVFFLFCAGFRTEHEPASKQRQLGGRRGVSRPAARIGNFFRSIFRRNGSSQRSQPASGGAEVEGGSGSGETVGLVPERLQFSTPQQRREAAEALSSAADRLQQAVNAIAGFAIRDLLSFLQPALQQPTAEEARQELQFAGLMLAPHQVEVLFVLCTLLGARRKGEAHQALANLGLIDVLGAMFDRLSWGVPPSTQGPHGAHCDCNPESALRVQYLRLVHNFLDRDSNNNPLKCLLLSEHERSLFTSGRFMPNTNGSGNVVYVEAGAPESEAQLPFAWRGRATRSGEEVNDANNGQPGGGEAGDRDGGADGWVDTRGLLSKIVDVFMREPMDSLYRFWLASCVEAFLRGGSTQEQLFITGGGLLPHLVKEITSDGMWCAGSLQTAFDLLGELCKGNRQVLEMLEACMTEKQLRRFLEVMVDNLVDSNVFMRSLVLSLENGGSAFRRHNIHGAGEGDGDYDDDDEEEEEEEKEESASRLSAVVPTDAAGGPAAGNDERGRSGDDNDDDDGEEEPCYLGHTWYDVRPRAIPEGREGDRQSRIASSGGRKTEGLQQFAAAAAGLERDEGADGEMSSRGDGDAVGLEEGAEAPQELTRLQRFLKQNTPQLVRDLMCVVNLETINHENICCLNTAVLILIFADQRGQLADVLEAVRNLPAGRGVSTEAEIDSEFDLDGDKEGLSWPSTGARSGGRLGRSNSSSSGGGGGGGGRCHHTDADPVENEGGVSPAEGGAALDGPAVLSGFRRLLWFWGEYYLRGGRDRLSLEFSTHVKFWAWKRVVRLLCADDGSPTALVDAPLRLPRSPYDTRPRRPAPSPCAPLPPAALSPQRQERVREEHL